MKSLQFVLALASLCAATMATGQPRRAVPPPPPPPPARAEADTTFLGRQIGQYEEFERTYKPRGVTPSNIESISIGGATWTAKNLSVTAFRNGDPIPEAKTAEEWQKACRMLQPVWCYYQFNAANAPQYGRLYSLDAVLDKRGLAPAGWHIPAAEEWERASQAVKEYPRDAVRSNGSGGLGFVQGGYFEDMKGSFTFHGMGKLGVWWSSTEIGSGMGVVWGFSLDGDNYSFGKNMHDNDGLAVRCVKDGQ